jgi:hypothetical protein
MVRFGGRVHAAATAARGAEVTVDRRSVPLPRPAGWMAPPWPNVFELARVFTPRPRLPKPTSRSGVSAINSASQLTPVAMAADPSL